MNFRKGNVGRPFALGAGVRCLLAITGGNYLENPASYERPDRTVPYTTRMWACTSCYRSVYESGTDPFTIQDCFNMYSTDVYQSVEIHSGTHLSLQLCYIMCCTHSDSCQHLQVRYTVCYTHAETHLHTLFCIRTVLQFCISAFNVES